jgi:DNA topoisomerase-3
MENPSKFITEKAMREYIGGGLGTPATRADIIEKLYNTFYIEKKGNTIYPAKRRKSG